MRFCVRYTGDPHTAEDLTQQTLLKAWRHEQRLKDPAARQGWLLSIARNECRMWGRGRGREQTRLVDLEVAHDADHDDPWSDAADLDLLLDRDDLVRLLDRALGLLSPEVRSLLVRRYLEETPQAELAARLGLGEGAVEARLHRGRRALRHVLTAELGDEAAAYGLIASTAAGWEATRVWCLVCGTRRLEGWFRPTEGKLYMRCPGCASSSGVHYIHSQLGDGFRGLKSYRPAISRVLGVIHDLFRLRGGGGVGPCPACGKPLPVTHGPAPWVPPAYTHPASVYLWCPACGVGDAETWQSLAWSLPEGRAFWQRHPRMRSLPPREITYAGSTAVVTAFESMADSARLEVVTLRDTLEVVSINGAAPKGARDDG